MTTAEKIKGMRFACRRRHAATHQAKHHEHCPLQDVLIVTFEDGSSLAVTDDVYLPAV